MYLKCLGFELQSKGIADGAAGLDGFVEYREVASNGSCKQVQVIEAAVLLLVVFELMRL